MCWATAAVFLSVLIMGVRIAGTNGERLGLAKTMLPGIDSLVMFFIFGLAGSAVFLISSGLRRGRRWSFYAAAAVAVLLIPVFLFGTIPGIFILSGILGRETKAWFKSRLAPSFSRTDSGPQALDPTK